MSWTIPSKEEADEFSKAYLASEESYMEQYYANEMIKPAKCHCGELFDAKTVRFAPSADVLTVNCLEDTQI